MRGIQDPGSDHRHGRGPRAHGRGVHHRPVAHVRRIERTGEPGLAERPGAVDHIRPVDGGAGAEVADQAEELVAQAGRQQGYREHAEQHRRVELALLARPALRTALDVAVDPLAQQAVQLPVPAGQDRGQVGTGLPPCAGDQQRPQ